MAYDVAVVGLGAFGSAAVDHLARAGLEVVGLDARTPPHAEASHHGDTRVIRKALFEHPDYVPWIERAYDLWRGLEADTGRSILEATGGLHLGTPEGTQVPGARRALNEHGHPFEELDRDAILARFPAFSPARDHEAVFEPDAGFLRVDEAIEGHLDRAREAGARLGTDRRVRRLEPRSDAIELETAGGDVEAERVVLAAGPWLADLAGEIGLELSVERRVQFVLEPPGALRGDGSRHPVFTYETEPGTVFYGIDRPDGRVKVAMHHHGRPTDPDDVDRRVTEADEAPLRELVGTYAPGLGWEVVDAMVCLYTNAPDGHLLLDEHPRDDRIALVGAGSGHGFKHASALGEGLAQLVTEGDTRLDRGLFSLER